MELIILGTASAIPNEDHENTSMVLDAPERLILIDSANNPIVRLRQAGLDILNLTDLILTHFHPDHVSGIPALLMNSWLLGRTEPLNIHGLPHTLERLETLMDLYLWQTWPNFFPVKFHSLPDQEKAVVLESKSLCVYASRVCHLIPTIGLRFDSLVTGKSVAFSGDTEPCGEVARLVEGVNVLIHEATGEGHGHSSARQAGEAALQAGAERLYLIHYPPDAEDLHDRVEQAMGAFGGHVGLALDFMRVEF